MLPFVFIEESFLHIFNTVVNNFIIDHSSRGCGHSQFEFTHKPAKQYLTYHKMVGIARLRIEGKIILGTLFYSFKK